MDSPILELKQVSVTYSNGEIGLKLIDLQMKSGEAVLVAGATGSGKSTMAQRILNVIPHQINAQCQGDVLLEGISTVGLPPHRLAKHLQLILQNPQDMLFALNVEGNIHFGLENLCLKRDEILSKTESVLDLLRLAELRKRSPLDLSGGEQQAAAIASVLATEPSLFILDEPLTYLDIEGKERLLKHLQTLKKQGRALLLLEHRIDLARLIADRVVVLREGEKVLDEPAGSVSDEQLKKEMGLRTDSIFDFTRPLLNPKGEGSNSQEDTWLEPKAIPAIQFQKVSFSYNEENSSKPVLKEIDLQIEPGECVAMLGPNGSGKSTLANCAIGLDIPQEGTILINGRELKKMDPKERATQMGLMFQRPETQLFCRSVREELYFGGKNIGLPKEILKERVDQEATELGLFPLMDRHPATLSRGEMRRLALASLLIMNPALLILDEPTVGQDYHHLNLIGKRLLRLNNEGQTLIVITHDRDFALALAHRVIEMDKGEVIQDAALKPLSRL